MAEVVERSRGEGRREEAKWVKDSSLELSTPG
jgi:hypothetical protein